MTSIRDFNRMKNFRLAIGRWKIVWKALFSRRKIDIIAIDGTFLSRKMYRMCLSLEIPLKSTNEAVNVNIPLYVYTMIRIKYITSCFLRRHQEDIDFCIFVGSRNSIQA